MAIDSNIGVQDLLENLGVRNQAPAPLYAWPDGSEPEHGPQSNLSRGGYDLSLANEKKRRYSFVTEFLAKRSFRDGDTN